MIAKFEPTKVKGFLAIFAYYISFNIQIYLSQSPSPLFIASSAKKKIYTVVLLKPLIYNNVEEN